MTDYMSSNRRSPDALTLGSDGPTSGWAREVAATETGVADARELGERSDHTDAIEIGSMAIRAEVAPRITFASHQCDVSVIGDLVVVNRGETDVEGLTLRLSAEPPVLAERTWVIDRVDAGSEFRPRDRRVEIGGGLLDRLTERMRAEVRLELRRGDRPLASASYPSRRWRATNGAAGATCRN